MNKTGNSQFNENANSSDNFVKHPENSFNFKTMPSLHQSFQKVQNTNTGCNIVHKQSEQEQKYLNQIISSKQFNFINISYKDSHNFNNNKFISSPNINLNALHSYNSTFVTPYENKYITQPQINSKSLNKLTHQLNKITLEGEQQVQKCENEAFEKDFNIQIQNNFNETDQEEDSSKVQLQVKRIGLYTKEERANKIQKYKQKLKNYRDAHPIKKLFTGRSIVAGSKPRIKGKFVKQEEFEKYQKDNYTNTSVSFSHENHRPQENGNDIQESQNIQQQKESEISFKNLFPQQQQQLQIQQQQSNHNINDLLNQSKIAAIINSQLIQQQNYNTLKQILLLQSALNIGSIPLFQNLPNISQLQNYEIMQQQLPFFHNFNQNLNFTQQRFNQLDQMQNSVGFLAVLKNQKQQDFLQQLQQLGRMNQQQNNLNTQQQQPISLIQDQQKPQTNQNQQLQMIKKEF